MVTRDAGGTEPPVLEMRGITKRYPGVLANDDITLDVRRGEVHALLGENGAGKTTLMNILYGLAVPDSGETLLNGSQVTIDSPSDAIRRGISMVHQHFMLIPVLSVADNMMLGQEAMSGPIFVNRADAHRRIRDLGAIFGWEIDPEQKVGTLSVGWQQRIEILKALYRQASILILDEPTAVLTPQETDEIFGVLRRLRSEGYAIVFISHKLNEVLEIADRITVIRRGKVVGSRQPDETTEEELAELMVGRAVELTVDRGESQPGDVMLTISGLVVRNDRGSDVVQDIDLEVRTGEILGIAGVAGNGQDELVEAIVGLRRPAEGTIHLAGRDITVSGARRRHRLGVGLVPADRHRFGMVLNFPLTDNFVLTDYYRPPFARGWLRLLRDDGAIAKHANRSIEAFDVRTPSATVRASTLSGGNQQKVVVAREFEGEQRLLVLDQPTRGLDVGSIEFIHRRTIGKRDAGTAILLVSAELDEVLELSDRIAVMYRGRIVAVRDGRGADRNEIGLLMATGGTQAGPPSATSNAVGA